MYNYATGTTNLFDWCAIKDKAILGPRAQQTLDLFHIAVQCTYARAFWRALKEFKGTKLPVLHPMAWATDLLMGKVCKTEEAGLIICGAWSLWMGRNGRRHGKKTWDSGAAVKHVAKMVQDLMCMDHERHEPAAVGRERWRKLEEGWLKINTDGSFHAQQLTGGGGVVLRDSAGQLVAAEAKWYENVPDVLCIEALAARDGVLAAAARGFSRVILEMDNLTLVNYLKAESGGRSTIAGLWHEIWELSRGF